MRGTEAGVDEMARVARLNDHTLKREPNGCCGLPLQRSCPHPNACLSCDHFRTSEQFLPVHRDQLTETDRLIAAATAQGSERKLEMNQSVRLNLVRIIEGVETFGNADEEDSMPPDHGPLALAVQRKSDTVTFRGLLVPVWRCYRGLIPRPRRTTTPRRRPSTRGRPSSLERPPALRPWRRSPRPSAS
jgi:hypothetical protein